MDKVNNNKVVKVIDLVPGDVKPLPSVHVDALDPETFWTEYVCKHQPLVIKGGVSNWPAVQKWHQAGYLEGLCEDEKTTIATSFNSVPGIPYRQKDTLARSLDKIRTLNQDDTFGMPSIAIPDKWKADLGQYPFLDERAAKRPLFYPQNRLFIYKNLSTEWHYHTTDETITSQLVGSKRISLFRLTGKQWPVYAPFIKANVHHMPNGRSYFPKDSELPILEGVLEQGDTLYIPPFWWHGVDPVDHQPGVTLAHCFKTPTRRMGDWQDPVMQELRRQMSGIGKLALHYHVTKSTISRKLANENWWPI